jgi:hypothetical protein
MLDKRTESIYYYFTRDICLIIYPDTGKYFIAERWGKHLLAEEKKAL